MTRLACPPASLSESYPHAPVCAKSVRYCAGKEPGQLHPTHAAHVHPLGRRCISKSLRRGPWQSPFHLARNLHALPPPCICTNPPRHWLWSHRGGDVIQHARNVRMPFWCTNGRRGTQHLEHTPRRRRSRVHVETRRGQAA